MLRQPGSSSSSPAATRRAVQVVSSSDDFDASSSSALDSAAVPSLAASRDSSSSSSDAASASASKRRFKSYRLRGPHEKPWLSDPAMNKTNWNNWIVRAFILLGFILAGVVGFFMVWPYKEGSVRPSLPPVRPATFDPLKTHLANANPCASTASSTKTTLPRWTRPSGRTRCSSTASAPAVSTGPPPTRRTRTSTPKGCTSCRPSPTKPRPSQTATCTPTTPST